jgi:hypothetical protein
MIATYHRYAPIHQAEDYLRLGWAPRPSLRGTHHEEWAVHMVWMCDCPPIEPHRRYNESFMRPQSP